LGQVNDALGKFDKGTYGLCEDCGDKIDRARLQALPYATLCIQCQHQRERS
jgi:DnaK suppressor protein